MNIKMYFKQNRITKNAYLRLRERHYRKLYLTGKYKFIDRSKDKYKLCIMLAGYKNFLIPSVMGRLKKYCPEDVDVCIITSGKWCEEINELCELNSWSYLSTDRNNINLAQNIAIDLHKNAQYIFKLDEDIFITDNYFNKMCDAFNNSSQLTDFDIGVLAPIITINGYGFASVIKEFNLVSAFEKKFGKIVIAAGHDKRIQYDAELARFMWGEEMQVDEIAYKLPNIDDINERFSEKKLALEPCPIRFSIGAILFHRSLWIAMDYFHVGKGSDMGNDEIQMCEYCMMNSRPILICNNTVVGHLSFGKQNESMAKYYKENEFLFLPESI